MTIQLQKLILILIRIVSFIFLSPGFSFKGLPAAIRFSVSISISLVIYFILPDIALVTSVLEFSISILKEIILGVSLAYVSKLIFGIVEIAGTLIDFQVGFSMASVYDPSAGKQLSNYGRIYYWLSIIVFFIMDMHHKMIEALIRSFDYFPLVVSEVNRGGVAEIVSVFSQVFALGFKLAVPIIVVVLVTDIVLGIISRTIPQINVLMLGMPMKTGISFILTLIALSWVVGSVGKNISMFTLYMERIYKAFRV